MGEGVPRGVTAARVLDAEAARAALAEAAAARDLDTTLSRVAEILLQRFGADAVFARVQRQGRPLFWAPPSGPLAADVIFPGWETWRDRDFAALNASESSGITVDLATARRYTSQEAAYQHGVRSAMRVALADELGAAIGFLVVCSTSPGTFHEADLRELDAFGQALSRYVRPAVLLEEQEAERRLLGHEAALLTEIAEAETEDELVAALAAHAREALRGDLAFTLVEAGPAPTVVSSPPDALDDAQWAAARRLIAGGKNKSIQERSRQTGAFGVSNLDNSAETPLERWMRDDLGMGSLCAATRSRNWGGLGLGIAVLRERRGGWTEGERSFLARIARVTEISIERLRTGKIAVDHTVRLERQAEMLATAAELLEALSSTDGLEAACDLISERLRGFFAAGHVAVGAIDMANGARQVLGFSSDVMRREEFNPSISESDREAYSRNELGLGDLLEDMRALGPMSDAVETLRRRGIQSLMKAPFRLSDGTVGVVTVGSAEPGRYGPADLEQLQDLCRPVGVAVDRVRLVGDMAATTAILDAKTRVLAALVPGATIESAAQVFVTETLKLFGANHAVAALARKGELHVAGIASEFAEAGRTETYLNEEDLDAPWRRVLTHAEPMLVRDLATAARVSGEDHLLGLGVRSIMRVPILDSQGLVKGIVTAAAPTPNRWDERDVANFMELSQSLGLVFERAGLEEAARERSEKVDALTRLLNTLNPNLPPDEVARLFAREVREYLEADAVMVYRFDQATGLRQRVALDAIVSNARTPDRVSLTDSGGYQGALATPRATFDARQPERAPAWIREAAVGMGYGSAVAVRLDAAGEAVGLIAAGTVEPGGLGPTALAILGAVAHPLGMLLERARVLTTLRLQTQRTQAVLDILAALGPAGTIEEAAGPVASALRSMYDADHCAIATFDGEQAVLVAIDTEVAPWKCGDRVAADQIWDRAAPASSVVHVIADLSAEADLNEVSGAARDHGMRSSVRVLIGSANDPLGIVTVGSRHPGRYSEQDAEQLALIVQPLGVAVRYFLGKRETQLRSERIEATNRILTRLSAGGTPEHLAQGFLAECRALFATRHALAVQFDQDSQTGRLLAIDSDFPGDGLPCEFVMDEMHSARLVRQPTPHLVPDARLEPNLNARHHHLIEAGMFSAIRAPLVVHDRVRGAVSIWGEGANRFTAEDTELLGTLTRPLALALEKASALESLGESELKYRSLVAQADEMIFLFDPQSLRVLDANAFTSHALAYSPHELTQITLDRFMDATIEAIGASFRDAMADGELHLSDARFQRADGTTFDVDVVASMVTYAGRQAVLVLARDVSERKALLRQLIQSQKMDSLGAMAGAVAHDFNNLLTTILGFAGLLKRSTTMDPEERENLALIEDAARRAADLTGRLLSFSRGGLVRFGRVDLRTVVEDTLQLAEPTMHATLSVTREIPDTPVYVEGDAGQLQQSLTNIVLNARDAMPEGGAIRVSLALEGAVAVVRIADTGPGMDEETRMRIFEPFYTTKPVGSGTGLGMAITYGIIQGHHGDIAVDSEPGKGTTFTISLPLHDYSEDAPHADAFNAGEGNLVLVVDDDAMVRRATTATLAELGYNVVEAPGGSTAVEILRARPDRFSAVLLDLVMPGMTGSETFRALTAVRPDLPVIVCTGYAADSHIDTDVKRRIAGLVQKPFTAERLGRALHAAGANPTRAPRI